VNALLLINPHLARYLTPFGIDYGKIHALVKGAAVANRLRIAGDLSTVFGGDFEFQFQTIVSKAVRTHAAKWGIAWEHH
jgi:hypothetical protein